MTGQHNPEWSESGVVVSVRGSVVDARFVKRLPQLHSVLRTGEADDIVIEVVSDQVTPKLDYVVTNGSFTPGVPKDSYAQVALISKKLDARMILDTSDEPLTLALEEGIFLKQA